MSKQHIVKSVFWVTISEIVFNFSGYVIQSSIGRFLGPADYGRYGIIITLTTMVIVLIGNGIPTAMSKYISECFETNIEKVRVIKRQAVYLQTIIISILTLIFYFSVPFIAKALGDPSLINLFRISTLIIPSFALASFYFSYYTGLHKFNIQSVLKTVRSLMRILFIVGLALIFRLKGAIVGAIIAPFATFGVAYLIDVFKTNKELEKSQHEQVKKTDSSVFFDWKKLVQYAWQIVIFFLAYELLISIDLYMVKGILRDDFITGIYNASLTVGRIPYFIFYALTIILLPVISKSTSQNDHKETRNVISQTLRLMLVILVPAIFLMSAFSRPIIHFFFSSKYNQAAYPMSVLVFGVGFLTIFYVMSYVMNGAGKTKIPMWLSIIGASINIFLNYFFIKSYGIVGSAVATSITSFIVASAMLYFLNRYFKVGFGTLSAAKALCGGFLIFFAARFLPAGNISFIFSGLFLFALYGLFLYLLGEIKKEDVLLIKKIIGKNKIEKVEENISGSEPRA
jgi:stage V sporulation protein B